MFDIMPDVRAEDRCSHSIRIKIISKNEFFVKEKNKSNDITLKWHLSSKSKKITVTTDKIYKGSSIGLLTKDQDSEMQLITMVPKSKDILIWKANNSGECRINYNLPAEMAGTKSEKMNMTFTLTDEF